MNKAEKILASVNGVSEAKRNFQTFTIAWPGTSKGSVALKKLDDKFIGTDDYMGISYFWHHEYKFHLREATAPQCKMVHDAWLKAGLKLDEVSDEHERILNKIVK